MTLEEATRQRIAEIIAAHPVTLFMKGRRGAPQCGFSATVIRILDALVPDYQTFDVLTDPEIRDGVKDYSSWPTIPQLYVRGEFVGGCDIIQELFASEELHSTLGVERPQVGEPKLEISAAAADALRRAEQDALGGNALHLGIDARFRSAFYLAPRSEGEISVESPGLELLMDPMSASRADGVRVDVADGPGGTTFQIDNPNAPR